MHALSADQGSRVAARSVSARYGSVTALDQVSVAFMPGEVHAVVGENGAGKTTLMRLLSGEEPPSEGTVLVDGAPVRMRGTQDARALGIGIVHQHSQLVETLTVEENLALGEVPTRSLAGLPWRTDHRKIHHRATKRLALFDMQHQARTLVSELSVAERQMVEIVRVLDGSSRALILDEPTASLAEAEAQRLFDTLRRMRDAGVCVILIAHSLEEVLSIADRITVLRNGRHITTVARHEVSHDALVALIMGRQVGTGFPAREAPADRVALRVEALLRRKDAPAVELSVRHGEIVGVPTYIGANVDGLLEQVRRSAPGIGLVPGDAMQDGLVPDMSIAENILLSMTSRLQCWGVIDRKRTRETALRMIQQLAIRPNDPDIPVSRLSGGNRQKVVIAKWLAAGARVLLLDDPTKAVDVGARVDIFHLIAGAAHDGAAVVFVSSNVEELVGMCHRILVVHQGTLVESYARAPFSKQEILGKVVGSRSSRAEVERRSHEPR